MSFDDKLNELVNEVEVPDELSPKNIALMLKAQSAQSKMEAEHRNIKSAPTISAQRRTIIMRTAAATAACAVFAAGMIAFNEHNKDDGKLEEQIEYAAVSPDSYDDLYNIYTGIYLDGNSSAEEKDTAETTVSSGETEAIEQTLPEKAETLSDLSSYDFPDVNESVVSKADIVKSDGESLFCLSEGKLYIISLETMEITAEVENKLNPPVELYVDGETLILVSKETEETQTVNKTDGSEIPDSINSNSGENSRSNVIADIYNISDKTDPICTASYKQNGSYTSSRIADGILYIVTGYSSSPTKPLDKEIDLDSYVPAYYINGEKNYVAAGDIIVPSNANSTDYTVISAIDFKSDSASMAVKAVLGSSKNVYCSADTLYVVGVGKNDETDYSIITSFDISGGMTYKASGLVAGKIVSQSAMNEYDGLFRIATVSDSGTSIYVLDDTLTVVNSAGQLLPGENVTAVRFTENYASIYADENSKPAMVIDLASNPPTHTQSLAGTSAYLYSFSDDKLLGLGISEDGSSLSLTMYNSENGLMYNTVDFASDLQDVCSKALDDRRALLIDKTTSLIGVPVYSHNEFGTKNQYYVFSYDDETGFSEIGVIEYNDLDDNSIFERAVINNDNLYIIGGTRIVSVRISDFKVLETIDL